MKFRILFLLGWISWFAPAQGPACHSVEGDRIRAQDLAAVFPEFHRVPAETLFGQAPLPGAQRIFHSPELRALARRFGIDLSSAPDTCFEWALQHLDRAGAIAAMQESLQIPDAKIEIADIISAPVPAGRIEFPLDSLGTPSPSGPSVPVLWRGAVVYGDSHRFPIWARVGITAPCRKLIAVESLKTGRPIEARQLRATTSACFPVSAKAIPPIPEVAGMVPLRPIAAGTELHLDFLALPNDVNRGDVVHIEVRSGAARLAFTGHALTGGRSGDTISVRNPDSNRTFQARVTGKGTAIVELGAPKGI